MKRVHLSATIDADIKKKWDKYCADEDIDSSRKVERLLKDYLKEKRRV